MELSSILNLSELLPKIYESFRNSKKERKEESKIALKALSDAILETRTYIKDSVKSRDTEVEKKIREYWSDAHLKLSTVNPEIATRCFSKAEYWTDPTSWDNEKIELYNITLDSMSDSLKSMEIN